MPAPDPVAAHLAHLRLRNLSPSTVRQRHYALARLARHLSCHTDDLLALVPDDLMQWQTEIAHLSPRYRSSWHSHVAAFYAWAAEEYGITSPAKVLVTVRLPRRLPNPISELDLDMAIRCAPERIRPWLVLAGYAGLRAAEIANLTREQVRDTADPPVLVISGKGGHERIVPLSRIVLDALQLAGLPSRGYVFPRADGLAGANRPWQVSHLVNSYLHGLGITHTLHSLRHRFGTQVYRVSKDLRVTQEVMGHASSSTTAPYADWSRSDAVDAVQRMGEGGLAVGRSTVRV